MKIYIVFGETGEYSDRQDWPVRAFRNDKQAAELVASASKAAKEIFSTKESIYRVPEGVNSFDPLMRMDYTGTDYYIVECELEEPCE